MALADEGKTDLAFDTDVLREYGAKYGAIADELRDMSAQLDSCLTELKDSGWTTPAGTAFHKMVETGWEENIKRYADLLDTLEKIMLDASRQYESLVVDHIQNTKLD